MMQGFRFSVQGSHEGCLPSSPIVSLNECRAVRSTPKICSVTARSDVKYLRCDCSGGVAACIVWGYAQRIWGFLLVGSLVFLLLSDLMLPLACLSWYGCCYSFF